MLSVKKNARKISNLFEMYFVTCVPMTSDDIGYVNLGDCCFRWHYTLSNIHMPPELFYRTSIIHMTTDMSHRIKTYIS